MGEMMYGSESVPITFDDRLLAHLQVVILSRFRRAESCGFSYAREESSGFSRETLWLSPSIPIRFSYTAANRGGPLNRAWVEELARVAANGELRIVPEPDAALEMSGATGLAARGGGRAVAARQR